MPEGTAGSSVWDVQVAFLTCSPLLGHLHQSLSDVSQDLKGGRENTQGMSKFAFLAKLTKRNVSSPTFAITLDGNLNFSGKLLSRFTVTGDGGRQFYGG